MIQKSIKWYNRFPPYRIFAINKTKGTGKDEDMEKTKIWKRRKHGKVEADGPNGLLSVSLVKKKAEH